MCLFNLYTRDLLHLRTANLELLYLFKIHFVILTYQIDKKILYYHCLTIFVSETSIRCKLRFVKKNENKHEHCLNQIVIILKGLQSPFNRAPVSPQIN